MSQTTDIEGDLAHHVSVEAARSEFKKATNDYWAMKDRHAQELAPLVERVSATKAAFFDAIRHPQR